MTKKAVAALLLSVAFLAGCDGQPDPRAYPGSESGVSWEAASARFQMTLPPCPVKEFHFDVQPRLTERLAFAFVAPKSCVDEFLKRYGDDPANPTRTWPIGDARPPYDEARPPFDADEMRQFGWTYDPKAKASLYTRLETPYHATFSAFVKSGPEETVYVRSRTSGFPDRSK
ncbi:hypothetical protein [Amycolatopsis dendrobii]|uniref:Lipoprotein n=1 Tax=Amycolatopsis dendrobii TaxID=2760662 RepID=A0A7W3Z9A4_9PSEU|nr:hypothetical protein [Amycolatopsis dendrobii]MBB1152549.1 hypothetical protein [Amycolatopsis dendrobii]